MVFEDQIDLMVQNDFEREALEEEEKEEQMKKEAEANIQEDLENQHEYGDISEVDSHLIQNGQRNE